MAKHSRENYQYVGHAHLPATKCNLEITAKYRIHLKSVWNSTTCFSPNPERLESIHSSCIGSANVTELLKITTIIS